MTFKGELLYPMKNDQVFRSPKTSRMRFLVVKIDLDGIEYNYIMQINLSTSTLPELVLSQMAL